MSTSFLHTEIFVWVELAQVLCVLLKPLYVLFICTTAPSQLENTGFVWTLTASGSYNLSAPSSTIILSLRKRRMIQNSYLGVNIHLDSCGSLLIVIYTESISVKIERCTNLGLTVSH